MTSGKSVLFTRANVPPSDSTIEDVPESQLIMPAIEYINPPDRQLLEQLVQDAIERFKSIELPSLLQISTQNEVRKILSQQWILDGIVANVLEKIPKPADDTDLTNQIIKLIDEHKDVIEKIVVDTYNEKMISDNLSNKANASEAEEQQRDLKQSIINDIKGDLNEIKGELRDLITATILSQQPNVGEIKNDVTNSILTALPDIKTDILATVASQQPDLTELKTDILATVASQQPALPDIKTDILATVASQQPNLAELKNEIKTDILATVASQQPNLADLKNELKTDILATVASQQPNLVELKNEIKTDILATVASQQPNLTELKNEILATVTSQQPDLTELKNDILSTVSAQQPDLTELKNDLKTDILATVASQQPDLTELKNDLKTDILATVSAQQPDLTELKNEILDTVASQQPNLTELKNEIKNEIKTDILATVASQQPKWPVVDLTTATPIPNKLVVAQVNDTLISINSLGKTKTYVASELFPSSPGLQQGDIAGIKQDGSIDKVLGCKFNDPVLLDAEYSSRVVYYDDMLNKTINVCEKDNNLYVLVTNGEPILLESDIGKTTASIVHLPSNLESIKNEYIIAYGKYTAIDLVSLVKITINMIDETPIVNIESRLTYKPTAVAEIIDMSYECSGNLDILILGLYIPSISNFEAALFSVNGDIVQGYSANAFATIPIISSNKSLHLLTLPGQITILSYANSKCFLLLPSNAQGRFSAGNTVIDSDSIDCVDLIYDTTNGVIMSLEKTISDNCYIQILDVFGPEMKILKTKKIGPEIMIPFSFSYDPFSGQYVILYTDALTSGTIKAKIFDHDGEQIHIQASYQCFGDYKTVSEPTVEYGRKLFPTDQNNFIAFWNSDSGIYKCVFNDSFGVQPSGFLGIINKIQNDSAEVVLKGQIYTDDRGLISSSYIGKKVYYDKSNAVFPDNLSITNNGNVLVGTVLSISKILVGL